MAQYEYELEEELTPLHEYEFESEADPFFGGLKRRLRKLAGSALKRLAPMAARLVAGAIPGVGVIAGPLAAKLASALTQEQQQELEATLNEAMQPESAMHSEYEAYPESHYELEGANPEYGGTHLEGMHPEYEGIPEAEYEGNPAYEGQPEYQGHPEFEGAYPEYESHYEVQPEGHMEAHPEYEAGLAHSEGVHMEAQLMEQIAHEAATAANEAEAESLVGALIPLAIRSSRTGAPAFRNAAPALARAAGRLTTALRRSPATRPLVRTLPTILRRTRASLVRQSARGPITPRRAVRTMAGETFRVLGNPTVCIKIVARSARMCRRCRR